MPSTVVKRFDYDAPTHRLDVLFTTGRAYSFHDVPVQTYLDMKAAFAKGRFFNAQVRGRFRFTEHPREEIDMTKRELIEPNPGDRRYVRRDEEGHFTKDQVDVGKSLAADRRQHSKTPAKKGEGDRGDRQN